MDLVFIAVEVGIFNLCFLKYKLHKIDLIGRGKGKSVVNNFSVCGREGNESNVQSRKIPRERWNTWVSVVQGKSRAQVF